MRNMHGVLTLVFSVLFAASAGSFGADSGAPSPGPGRAADGGAPFDYDSLVLDGGLAYGGQGKRDVAEMQLPGQIGSVSFTLCLSFMPPQVGFVFDYDDAASNQNIRRVPGKEELLKALPGLFKAIRGKVQRLREEAARSGQVDRNLPLLVYAQDRIARADGKESLRRHEQFRRCAGLEIVALSSAAAAAGEVSWDVAGLLEGAAAALRLTRDAAGKRLLLVKAGGGWREAESAEAVGFEEAVVEYVIPFLTQRRPVPDIVFELKNEIGEMLLPLRREVPRPE